MNRSITYLQYANPAAYPPLEHSTRILADRGWTVHVLGGGTSGASDTFCFPPHPRIFLKRWRRAVPGVRQKIHYVAFSLWSAWRIFLTGSKWIYASDPLSCPAAWLAGWLPGRKVIYHEHDAHVGPVASVFMRWVLRLRRKVCQRAVAVVVPNAERAREFEASVRPVGPVLTVWNCPRREEVPGSFLARSNRPVIFYHGSLNAQRLPTTVLTALSLVPGKPALEFAGYTTGGAHDFVEKFLAEAANLGLAEQVRYLGAPTSRAELLAFCARADIGLSLVPSSSADPNMRAMAGASNKPFDYLASGLVLVVSDLPDWRALFVDAGVARPCRPEQSESIAAAITGWVQDRALADQARTSGRERIRRTWNYESQFEPVLRILEPVSGHKSAH